MESRRQNQVLALQRRITGPEAGKEETNKNHRGAAYVELGCSLGIPGHLAFASVRWAGHCTPAVVDGRLWIKTFTPRRSLILQLYAWSDERWRVDARYEHKSDSQVG